MKAALVTLLLADAGVAAAVGDRVHWDERVQGGALPAVVLHAAGGGGDDYHLRGRIDRRETRVQVDCLGQTYLAADELAGAVRDCLSGYRGSVGGVRFTGIFLDGAPRDIGDGGGAATPRLYGIALDFMVNHSTGA